MYEKFWEVHHSLLDPEQYLHSLMLQELGNATVQLAMTTVMATLLLSILFYREMISRVLTCTHYPQLTGFIAAQEQIAYSTNLYTKPYQPLIEQTILKESSGIFFFS